MSGPQLTQKQENTLAALLVSSTISSAAKSAGVSDASISLWINHDPEFKRRLRSSNEARLQAAIAQSVNQLGQSFAVLASVRDDPKIAASVRVRAAKEIIALHLKAREQGDILQRLEAIETAMTEHLMVNLQ